MIALIILIVIVVLLVLYGIAPYTGLIRNRNPAESALTHDSAQAHPRTAPNTHPLAPRHS